MYRYIVTEKATDYTERIPENKGHSIGQSGMPFAPSAGERRFKTPMGLNANGFFSRPSSPPPSPPSFLV